MEEKPQDNQPNNTLNNPTGSSDPDPFEPVGTAQEAVSPQPQEYQPKEPAVGEPQAITSAPDPQPTETPEQTTQDPQFHQPQTPPETAQFISFSEAQTLGTTLSNSQKIKRLFFQVLIACLVATATLAVVAVLTGGFSDILGKAIGTIALVAFHAILSLGYITNSEKKESMPGAKTLGLFSTTVFTLIVLSFITSVFAVWGLLDSDLTFRLYGIYTIILFATLHTDVLYRMNGQDKKIDYVINANYVFIAIVASMLIFLILAGQSAANFGDMYYRILAALGIIDATLTISAVIMHKLFMQKHPEIAAAVDKANEKAGSNFWKNPIVILVLLYVFLQFMGLVFGALRGY